MTKSITTSPRILRAAAAVWLVLLRAPGISGQGVGAGTGGAIHLAQEARYLQEGRRVLVIGAHPDDEDTELITILSRGMGVETGYLSLTRGEGGQNLIGTELGPALGIVRTEELLASRRIDGGRQFFTRAYDFGFSKTATESFEFWPRDSLVKDIVRVIRRFQPHVIVSVWSGTPLDGHGHHQASGIVAREAFDAAQDSTRFPALVAEEGLAPWRPLKFYRDYRAEGPGQTFNGGALDPAVGQSYRQIAATARSQHRSQDMGALEEPGPSSRRIVLEAVARGLDLARDTALFAGVVPVSTEYDMTRRVPLALAAAGVVFDAYTDDAEVTPGQPLDITLLAWNAGTDTARVGMSMDWGDGQGVNVLVDRGTDACPSQAISLPPDSVFRCTVHAAVRSDARPSQPYFMIQPQDGALYRFDGSPAAWGDPMGPPPEARFGYSVRPGFRAIQYLPIVARSVDQGIGEVRTPLTVVPPFMLTVSPAVILWPEGSGSRTVTVSVEHAAGDTTTAQIRLVAPGDWTVSPSQSVSFTGEGERRTLTFTVAPPTRTSTAEATLFAEAIVGRDTFRLGAERIRYPHITPRIVFHPAEARVVVAPIAFAEGRRIGYVRGAADAIPEALAAAGVPFRLLDPTELEGAALDSLDVLVIGPRAYEIDPALGRANSQLLEFARGGGTLIVQYQQYQYVAGGYAPYPLTIGRPHDRVTDERSPVRWLPGAERLQRAPNALAPSDFDGWVQERGLYFAATWDSAWTPLMAMHDADEPSKEGALLVAAYGQGTVVYSGIAFFRQLPAAVPGAWRLFANLLALGAP